MTYCIDTDVMIDFFKHKEPAKELITRLSKQGTLALSTLTITELRSGWTSEQAAFHLPRLYALCSIVPVGKEIAEQAGIWRREYKAKGKQLGTPDTVIAATAYLSHASLVTNNAKDYPMGNYSSTVSRAKRLHRYPSQNLPFLMGFETMSLACLSVTPVYQHKTRPLTCRRTLFTRPAVNASSLIRHQEPSQSA